MAPPPHACQDCARIATIQDCPLQGLSLDRTAPCSLHGLLSGISTVGVPLPPSVPPSSPLPPPPLPPSPLPPTLPSSLTSYPFPCSTHPFVLGFVFNIFLAFHLLSPHLLSPSDLSFIQMAIFRLLALLAVSSLNGCHPDLSIGSEMLTTTLFGQPCQECLAKCPNI